METFLTLVCVTASLLLWVIQMCMFIRAILSWFPTAEGGFFSRLTYAVTEPLIIPVRNLLSRISVFADSPLDLSFLFTFLLISILRIFLPVVQF